MGRLKKFNNFGGLNLMSDVFIETGTFEGETFDAAIAAGYPEVHTIDVVASYAKKVKLRHKDKDHVHCHVGTSPEILPKILDKTKFTTFWLDGHYQNNTIEEQCPKYGQCPVLAELRLIFSIDWQKFPIVLIDDVCLFNNGVNSKFKAEDWPSRQDILNLVPNSYIVFDHNDIMVLHSKN